MAFQGLCGVTQACLCNNIPSENFTEPSPSDTLGLNPQQALHFYLFFYWIQKQWLSTCWVPGTVLGSRGRWHCEKIHRSPAVIDLTFWRWTTWVSKTGFSYMVAECMQKKKAGKCGDAAGWLAALLCVHLVIPLPLSSHDEHLHLSPSTQVFFLNSHSSMKPSYLTADLHNAKMVRKATVRSSAWKGCVFHRTQYFAYVETQAPVGLAMPPFTFPCVLLACIF